MVKRIVSDKQRQKLADRQLAQKKFQELPAWCRQTPEVVEAYVNSNAVDFISIKSILKEMAKMLILLRKMIEE